MMADGTGRNTQDILKDIVRVLTTSNSLEEAQVPDMSNLTSQKKPKFFLGGNTSSGQAFSRNIHSNHCCKHVTACKIKETTT